VNTNTIPITPANDSSHVIRIVLSDLLNGLILSLIALGVAFLIGWLLDEFGYWR